MGRAWGGSGCRAGNAGLSLLLIRSNLNERSRAIENEPRHRQPRECLRCFFETRLTCLGMRCTRSTWLHTHCQNISDLPTRIGQNLLKTLTVEDRSAPAVPMRIVAKAVSSPLRGNHCVMAGRPTLATTDVRPGAPVDIGSRLRFLKMSAVNLRPAGPHLKTGMDRTRGAGCGAPIRSNLSGISQHVLK
jgi:hypothetical protein